ncbi:hypothetical protein J4573_31475 [Actinomadura barringtoniae]|uniref:Uncharacterized protein n=1 Tax=Actinomadura barringtoniae TaxID=1427535 RepID=A0A939PG44_9ACTN|nr:hypothetical protein [Actinomadura barringtoniae]MBO2451648.1 hypothetical protein [Actinomadura barringtoniae]
MTTITETAETAVRNPRELISPDLFNTLVERVRKEYVKVARWYAELMVEQMLCFLATTASYDPSSPPAGIAPDGMVFMHLTPSEEIDDAYHAFLDLTKDYRETCEGLTGGRFIDHVPVSNSDIVSGRSVALTVAAMRNAGWPVDERFWATGVSCCTDICQGRVATI